MLDLSLATELQGQDSSVSLGQGLPDSGSVLSLSDAHMLCTSVCGRCLGFCAQLGNILAYLYEKGACACVWRGLGNVQVSTKSHIFPGFQSMFPGS